MATDGLTSVCNNSSSGDAMRKTAAIAEAAIKKSTRFNTASVADLVTWTSDYKYSSQDDRHTKMVREFYDFTIIRLSVDSLDDVKDNPEFGVLAEDVKDQWTRKLAEVHALMAFCLWTVLIPYYVKERTKLGTKGKHWRPLEATSPIKRDRLNAYDLVKTLKASDFITGAPAEPLLEYYDWDLVADDERLRSLLARDFSVDGENAETGGTYTHTIRGVASTFVRVMWVALIVFGREPHHLSAIRPLTAKDFCVLVHGHGIPEDLLTGAREDPPINYNQLTSNDGGIVPCKEWTFLTAITGDAFYPDIFLPTAFFLMRAQKLAEGCKEPNIDQDFLCRQIYNSSSDTTVASFNNNLASVFGALKCCGADRYKPDAMDVAAMRAYGVDTHALEASGLALTYSVHKYIDAFCDDFLAARRTIRANVTISRALDRGGLKSKKCAGRLPDMDNDGLRDMMKALREQVWRPVWVSVIQPWLRQRNLPADPQGFFLATESDGMKDFADSKGFTRADAERVELLLMLHLSVFKSQVWRDSVVEEFELVQHNGNAFYKFSLSPETESMLVHTVLLVCRPLLATGSKRSQRMFMDSNGAPVTQRWIERRIEELGKNWLAVPRLGPHSLRTMWLSWLVGAGLVNEHDLDNLAAYVQVGRCTMLESYCAPSLSGPAQRVGQALRDGGLNVAAPQQASESVASPDSAGQAERPQVPYGRQLAAIRDRCKAQAQAVVQAHGGDQKAALASLVRKRKRNELSESENFFSFEVTYIEDTNTKAWNKLCEKKPV
ncbi:hypothetical protein JKP88DRAFT_253539 [Tribonema minus]|uniref:Uncharacterized protein n=1 Tax=Tribonema minus TaxID=303371 RepID=A0A835ZBI2_9STRA|nr:hypothetical protein JKP88DRAFT_253539 [Tribonema minus]